MTVLDTHEHIQHTETGLMSKTQTAEYLGISMSMLEQAVSAEENPIPSYKIGRRRMFRKSKVDAWLERCEEA